MESGGILEATGFTAGRIPETCTINSGVIMADSTLACSAPATGTLSGDIRRANHGTQS